jgi:hypothetical protein
MSPPAEPGVYQNEIKNKRAKRVLTGKGGFFDLFGGDL